MSEVVKLIQKFEKFDYSFDKRNRFHETSTLRLNSTKAKVKLGWTCKWNLSEALRRTIEWNRSFKKKVSPENMCVQQFLMYINNR